MKVGRLAGNAVLVLVLAVLPAGSAYPVGGDDE
jgi:hypothetical protein